VTLRVFVYGMRGREAIRLIFLSTLGGNKYCKEAPGPCTWLGLSIDSGGSVDVTERAREKFVYHFIVY